jgi:hypothetical protein
VIGFCTFPSPISSRPAAVHRARLANSQRLLGRPGQCGPASDAITKRWLNCLKHSVGNTLDDGMTERHRRGPCLKNGGNSEPVGGRLRTFASLFPDQHSPIRHH